MSIVKIMAVENWPAVPGHVRQTITWSGIRRAVSKDGLYWLVKKDKPFSRWHWRPVNGMYVKLKEAV